MTSNTPLQLLGKVSTQKPNQHHLPPLLPSTLQPTEPLSTVDTQKINSRNSFGFSKMTFYDGCSLSRNYCSVSTVGSVTNADFCRDSSYNNVNAVSYIVEHQLPRLFNSMIEDLLIVRPEKDIDKWMLNWFEDAYERRQSEILQSSTQKRGAHRFLTRLPSDGNDSIGDDGAFPQGRPKGSVMSKTYLSPQHSSSVQTSRVLSNTMEDDTFARPRNEMSSMQCSIFDYTPLHVPALPQHGASLLSHNDDARQSTDTPVVRTFTAQYSLSALQEQHRLSATGRGGGGAGSCGGDGRLKLRSPRTVDIGGSDESFTSSLT